jgi:deoxycytidylate deaminase
MPHEKDYGDQIDYHLCAIIVRGGSVISVCYNKHNTNAFVEYYTDITRGKGRDFCLSTHAEQDAILGHVTRLICVAVRFCSP